MSEVDPFFGGFPIDPDAIARLKEHGFAGIVDDLSEIWPVRNVSLDIYREWARHESPWVCPADNGFILAFSFVKGRDLEAEINAQTSIQEALGPTGFDINAVQLNAGLNVIKALKEKYIAANALPTFYVAFGAAMVIAASRDTGMGNNKALVNHVITDVPDMPIDFQDTQAILFSEEFRDFNPYFRDTLYEVANRSGEDSLRYLVYGAKFAMEHIRQSVESIALDRALQASIEDLTDPGSET